MSEPELPDWIRSHVELYRRDPDAGHMFDTTAMGKPGRTPALLLTTKGAKSGKPRLLPLFYGASEKGFVVIASKGGAPADPAWYRNLAADPNVEIQVGKNHYKAKARTATGAEREKLWAEMLKVWPPYSDYQTKTKREIPVVVIEPKTV